MGLDMNLFTTESKPTSVTDFPTPQDTEDLAYWRKFNNLHGWMKDLYIKKGGKDLSFNGVNLLLEEEDFDRLYMDIKDLPPTSGFFFGSQLSVDDERIKEVKKLCIECKYLIKEGMFVFYNGDY